MTLLCVRDRKARLAYMEEIPSGDPKFLEPILRCLVELTPEPMKEIQASEIVVLVVGESLEPFEELLLSEGVPRREVFSTKQEERLGMKLD